MRDSARRARTMVAAALCAVALAVMAPAWACVSGVTVLLDRDLVGPGGEIEVTLRVAGSPNAPPLALRLDRLDAPPLVTLAPTVDPTVLRVQIPSTIGLGQHVLIANDDPYPRPAGRQDYITGRALFSVVDPALAAGNPSIETVIDFAPPVPFPTLNDQLWNMGALVLRLHHGDVTEGDLVSQPGEGLAGFLARTRNTLQPYGKPPVMVDSITLKGQVERVSLGPLAGQVATMRVLGLPAPEKVSSQHNTSGLPFALAAFATVAVLVVTAGAVALARRR